MGLSSPFNTDKSTRVVAQVQQLLQRLVDEDDADERRERLLGEARDVAHQRAGVRRHQQQAEEGGPQADAGAQRQSAIESLFGASMTGIAYSLFAGQPLTILGSTGPVLVFEKILFKFCKEYGLSYLSLRACIGLWTSFLCLLLVATDASSLVCYITRFTEEAFASLICIIFIYEALEKLLHLGHHYPINKHNDLQTLTQYSSVTPLGTGGTFRFSCVVG
ncbi:hypothetical protein CRUP_029556 [Coryphaenoides rupestris]|nr:hypothetical protein CRUP_029556 [Coryphaenoides rupestris]